MSLCVDDNPVVIPSMAYEEKSGKLYEKQQVYYGTHFRIKQSPDI